MSCRRDLMLRLHDLSANISLPQCFYSRCDYRCKEHKIRLSFNADFPTDLVLHYLLDSSSMPSCRYLQNLNSQDLPSLANGMNHAQVMSHVKICYVGYFLSSFVETARGAAGFMSAENRTGRLQPFPPQRISHTFYQLIA
jgi:hypothetical protein